MEYSIGKFAKDFSAKYTNPLDDGHQKIACALNATLATPGIIQ